LLPAASMRVGAGILVGMVHGCIAGVTRRQGACLRHERTPLGIGLAFLFRHYCVSLLVRRVDNHA
jgi:hypothetical protein